MSLEKEIIHNDFNRFNNTGSWMLDSIYHMTLDNLKSHFCRENFRIFLYSKYCYWCHYIMLLNV